MRRLHVRWPTENPVSDPFFLYFASETSFRSLDLWGVCCSGRSCQARYDVHAPGHCHCVYPRWWPRTAEPYALTPLAYAAKARTIILTLRLSEGLAKQRPRPTPSDPYPLVRTLIGSNADVWKQYVRHDFVRQLGEGTLERERFLHFIKYVAVLNRPPSGDPLTLLFKAGLSLPQVLR